MNVVFLLNNTQEYEIFYFHHNLFESLMQGLVVHKRHFQKMDNPLFQWILMKNLSLGKNDITSIVLNYSENTVRIFRSYKMPNP